MDLELRKDGLGDGVLDGLKLKWEMESKRVAHTCCPMLSSRIFIVILL